MNTVGYGAPAPAARGCLFWGLVIGALGMALFVALFAAAAWFGLGLFAEQARTAMQENAVIRQHIGRIARADLDFMASMAESDMDTFVFDLEGDRDKGRVIAEFVTVDADTERLGDGRLRLADGREFDLAGPAGDALPELEPGDKSTVKP